MEVVFEWHDLDRQRTPEEAPFQLEVHGLGGSVKDWRE